MDLPDIEVPDLEKQHVFVIVLVLGLVLSVYFEVPGFIYHDGSERAISIASSNPFMVEYEQNNQVDDISTSQLEPSTIQALKDGGDIPQTTSDNVYIVDYVKNGSIGVSAYVDVSRGEVVDNKYNFRVD